MPATQLRWNHSQENSCKNNSKPDHTFNQTLNRIFQDIRCPNYGGRKMLNSKNLKTDSLEE